MTAAALRVSLRKELRALLPMWAACMVGVLVAGIWGQTPLRSVAMTVYVVGSIGLGAQLMGQEYTYRTLGLVLSQPVDRRRVLLVKLAVAAPLLLILGAASLSTLVPSLYVSVDGSTIAFHIGAVVLLSSLCLAPTLAMMSRSSLAGLVFTGGIAGGVHAASEMVGQGAFATLWFWYTMLLVCALGALVGWRQFTRLEHIEGGGRDLHLPGVLSWSAAVRAAGVPVRNPIARLIAKELRLQQLTFAVVAVSVLSGLALLARRSFDADSAANVVIPVTFLYAASLPLLIGALASAQERQMGTLQWQQLLPVPARVQFAVKTIVALVLALVLALGLPLLAMTLLGVNTKSDSDAWPLMAVGIVLVTSASLYVSSLSSSGIRAIMTALPSLVVTYVAAQWVGRQFSALLMRVFMDRPDWRPFMTSIMRTSWEYDVLNLFTLGLGLSALLVYFAHRNHHSLERPLTQLKRQSGWIAGAIVAVMAISVFSHMV